MSPIEYQWKSFDGLNIYALQWPSAGQTEAVVAFVHGHGDHCRRYDDWFLMLAARNISVLTLDYRGHGRSQGKRGVINRYSDLLQDVALLHEKAKALFPKTPVVLYGHSLGATLVLSHLLRSISKPDLAIASSPWLRLNKSPGKIVSILIKAANLLAPFVTFRTGLHASDFSTIDGFSEKREKDKLVHNRMSPRLFSEVKYEVQWIINHIASIETPLLMMQGRGDLIMNEMAARELYQQSENCISYYDWKNVGHQLHNSERSAEIMDFLIGWIKERI
jgi:acylglycerol lipase